MSNMGCKSLQFTVSHYHGSVTTCCCLASLQSRQVGGKSTRERMRKRAVGGIKKMKYIWKKKRRKKVEEISHQIGVKKPENESKGDRKQERTDQCSNVFLGPLPPHFPSDLHGHLAALGGTTSMFPLARLVVHQRVCLFVCLPPRTWSRRHLPGPQPPFSFFLSSLSAVFLCGWKRAHTCAHTGKNLTGCFSELEFSVPRNTLAKRLSVHSQKLVSASTIKLSIKCSLVHFSS